MTNVQMKRDDKTRCQAFNKMSVSVSNEDDDAKMTAKLNQRKLNTLPSTEDALTEWLIRQNKGF